MSLMLDQFSGNPWEEGHNRAFLPLVFPLCCRWAVWELPALETMFSLLATEERELDQCWDLNRSPLGFSSLRCMLSPHQGWNLLCWFVKWARDLQSSAVPNPSPDVRVGFHPLCHCTPRPAGESLLFAHTWLQAACTAFSPFMGQGVAVWSLSSRVG